MRAFFIFCFLSLSVLSAEIIEIKYMSELDKYLDEKALIIFDLDNTIMEAVQEVGQDQWFNHRKQMHEKMGLSSREALEKALLEWMAVQCITKVKLVEPYTQALIKELQEKKRAIIGLTIRGLGLATTSIHQLKSLDVFLDRTALTKEEIFFQNGEACLFRQGILFTAGSNKGSALKKLLEILKYHPKAIVFIDDKISSLKGIEEFCKEKGIAFTGLRYGFLDDKVKNFRSNIADIQFERFKNILTDQQAEKYLAAETNSDPTHKRLSQE